MKVKYLGDNEVYEIYGTVYMKQYWYGESPYRLCFVIYKDMIFQTIETSMFVPIENNESEVKVIWR